ncbi:peptidylprolyl isomerase [Oribacterium parvum]|uniref:peptidylprolyl isomerase n=1 Tax=Oribacterium parvum TaxID=1501329 RepID=UPI0028EEB43F|nr:peptidylprolyl isomerase [Oribacterium parvum]
MNLFLFKEGRRRVGFRSYLFFVLLFSVLFFNSCKGIAISGKTENVPGYSKAEAMLVLGSERNRYQNIMGPEVWNIPITGQLEKTYGAYFIDKTKEFLQDIRTLNLLAEEKGIQPNSTEMEGIRKAANKFYTSLSEEDKAFFGDCTEKDVVDMYSAYFTAEKTVDALLSKVDTELSAAESKVIRIEQIVVSDEETARDLLEKVRTSGANFTYYARQYSEDPEFQKQLSFGEKEDKVYETAFSLNNNEISDIVSENGKFYIIKCLDSYDEEATKDRKERLEQSIRVLRFNESYDAYQKEHIVRFREPFWKTIDLHAGEGSTADFFFSVYQEYVKIDK